MQREFPYILRSFVEADKPFIYNSYMFSYHDYSDLRIVPKILYNTNQLEVINWLFAHAEILIICFPEEPDAIIGYIIHQIVNNVLIIHYVYIKNSFRGQGMFQKIVEPLVPLTTEETTTVIATHITTGYFKVRNKINKVIMTYDPYLITNWRLNAAR